MTGGALSRYHDQAGQSTKRVDSNKICTDSQADGTGSMWSISSADARIDVGLGTKLCGCQTGIAAPQEHRIGLV